VNLMHAEKTKNRPFSLGIYLLIVFALTWPFQIAYVIWGKTQLLSYGLSSMSMIMVAVGTFIAGRYVFKDNFTDAGWNWGKPWHYLAVIGFAVLLWVVPTFAGLMLGTYTIAGLQACFSHRFYFTCSQNSSSRLCRLSGKSLGGADICCPALLKSIPQGKQCCCTQLSGGPGICQQLSESG